MEFASTSSNQFLIRASGGVGIGTASPKGALHVASGGVAVTGTSSPYYTIGGGVFMEFSTAGAGHVFAYDCFAAVPKSLCLNAPGGNVGIGTSTPANKLHVAGGITCTTLTETSDRNAKEHFVPISPSEVLAKVAALPISTWNFKETQDHRHLGPMAQDFFAAFGLGQGETTISSVDANGVALAAIQGLNEKLEEALKRQGAENAALRARLERLERTVRRLTGAQGGRAPA